MEELRTIIRELKNILGQEGLDIEADVLLHEAVKMYISANIDKGYKERYGNQGKVDSGASGKGIEPATPKQEAFLKSVNKFKEGMTKQEAFGIIAEMSKNKKNYKESKEYKEY